MPTRSGKEYLISHECQSCPPSQRYYSNKKFNHKCSVGGNTVKKWHYDK